MDSNSNKNPPGTCALLIWGVPKRLKKLFKSKCAQQNISMKDFVIEKMKEYVGSINKDA